MATKVYSDGIFIIVEQNTLLHNINKSNFDFSFNSGQVVLFDNSNSTSVTDLFDNIQDGAGTPIGGTLELIKAYILSISQAPSAGLPTGAATAANQEKKNIGKILDLTTSSADPLAYPFTLDSIEINGTAITPTPAISQQITNSKDLVGVLAIIQDLYLFSIVDSNNLLLNSGSLPLSDIVQFKIFANSGAQAFTYSTFVDSSDSELSSTQQILERLKALQADSVKSKNEILEQINNIFTELTHEHQPFTSSNTTAVSLPTAGVEYLVAAFRLKAASPDVKVSNFSVDIQSLSNDDLKVRIGINKTLSAAIIEANWVDVDANSQFQVARIGVAGLTSKTATGFDLGGRNIRTKRIFAGGQEFQSTEEVTVIQGVIFYVTVQPSGNLGSCNDDENWGERII